MAPENRKKTGRGAHLAEAGKGTRFKPGQSGNPGGRPPRPANYEAFREAMRDRSPVALKAIDEALEAGDTQAAFQVLQHAWGKAPSAPEDLDAVREGFASFTSLITEAAKRDKAGS